MTLTIATRDDMGPVTRLLVSHPSWHYSTQHGDGGTIVIIVDLPPGWVTQGRVTA